MKQRITTRSWGRAASLGWLAALLVCVAMAAALVHRALTSPFDGLPAVTVWVAGDAAKVRPQDKPRAAAKGARLFAARDEVAAFQVVITAHGAVAQGVDLRPHELSGPAGRVIPATAVSLFREAMLNVQVPSRIRPRGDERGLWPDALIPIGKDAFFHEKRRGAPFDVASNSNQPVWAEIRVPEDAAPGDYSGSIDVTLSDGSAFSVPVQLHVWDFTMPRTSSLATSFGIDSGIQSGHRLPPDATTALARLYVRMALSHRISLWGLWFINGLPYYEYDPIHPGTATIVDWSRYDDLYAEAMVGTPEGRATTIDLPAQTVLRSELPPPATRLDGVSDGGSLEKADYVYRVTAVNAGGETEGSAIVSARVPTDGVVRLSWEPAIQTTWPQLNARCYNVYRSRNPRVPEDDNPATYRLDTVVGTTYTDAGIRVEHRSIPCPNANGTADREALAIYRTWAEHLRAKGWLDRAYLYAEDEPFSSKALERARKHALLWRQAAPKGRSLVTNVYSPVLEGAVNLWCVVLNWFDDGEHGRASDIARRQAAGEQVWWYQSTMSRGEPTHRGGAWPSFFVDDTAMAARITGFFTWRFGFNGFLYYLTDMAFQKDNDPWVNQFYFHANGDGTLFYPGTPDRIGGTHNIPVASLRLALIRQGLQDYEYLKRVADSGDKPFADRQAATLVQAADRFTNDGDADKVAEARIALGRRIEELQSGAR